MPVHLVLQCSFADLIESMKVEGNPAAVREQQAVKAHHQPGLIWAVTAAAVPITLDPRGTKTLCRSAE